VDISRSNEKKNGILYLLMLIAAIAVILFSVIGIATMTGHMPSALSKNDPDIKREPTNKEQAATRSGEAPNTTAPAATRPRAAARGGASCSDCGVVESIRAVENKGQGSGVGAVTGGVVGGVLGNQFGHGGGRTAMTVVGAGAGAFTGNEIEKNMNRTVSYQVRVRMHDGTYRTVHERSRPPFNVGQRVRVTDHGVVAAG
jgi:outer membrane lipoprotein SlyB